MPLDSYHPTRIKDLQDTPRLRLHHPPFFLRELVDVKDKYKAFASIYKAPEEGVIRAHLILVLNAKGGLVETLPGPVNIGPYIGRLTQKFGKEVVKECVANTFDIEVALDSIKLTDYSRLNKLLFKLEHK